MLHLKCLPPTVMIKLQRHYFFQQEAHVNLYLSTPSIFVAAAFTAHLFQQGMQHLLLSLYLFI